MMQRRADEGRDLPTTAGIPLVIDARTAVWRRSLLLLALCAYLKVSAVRIFRVAAWALAGRRHLEHKLLDANVAPAVPLPLDPQVASVAAGAAALDRPVYIASVAPSPLLCEVASSHPDIAGVMAADVAGRRLSEGNLTAFLGQFPQGFEVVTGGRRAEIRRYPAAGFQAGGSSARMPLAAAAPGFATPSPIRELLRGLRLHQCVKNLLVFVPIILGGRLTDLAEVAYTVMAFVALSAIASATYLVNDIWDVAEDRRHWSKRHRPIAAGRLAPASALSIASLGICLGVGLGFLVSFKTGAMLVLYLTITLAYSLHLKTVAFADGLALATLFTVRLGIGAAAADVPPSPWLFVFSMFLFASLSYAKRHTELVKAAAREHNGSNGRGYRPIDAPMLLTVGLSAGIGAVLIMVLYIVEEAFRNSFYGSTAWLWGFPPLVFLFVVRIWLLSARGEMNDDPVAFAIKDRISIGLMGLLMLCFAFAWLG